MIQVEFGEVEAVIHYDILTDHVACNNRLAYSDRCHGAAGVLHQRVRKNVVAHGEREPRGGKRRELLRLCAVGRRACDIL